MQIKFEGYVLVNVTKNQHVLIKDIIIDEVSYENVLCKNALKSTKSRFINLN